MRVPLLVALVPALAAVLLSSFPVAAHAETCPNEQLRSEAHSANLPDCRAYELVTPSFTEAAEVRLREGTFELGGFGGMSANGSSVVVNGLGDLGDGNGAAADNSYELTRTASGWSETDVDVPVSRFPADVVAAAEEHKALLGEQSAPLEASEPLQAAPNFEEFLYNSPHDHTEEPLKEYPGSFWIGEPDGALHRLGPGEGKFVGASTDLSHVLFEAEHEGGRLEEDEYVPGQEVPPVPVGVDPSGMVCSAGYSSPPNHAVGDVPGYGSRGMSADGSVVFFHVPASGCAPGDPSVSEIFARITEPALCAAQGLGPPCTVAISEPSTEACAACDTNAAVQVASEIIDGVSADGSKVFFTTTQPLLGGESETSANIYEYDLDPGAGEEHVSRITAGRWAAGGAQVQSVAGVSEDGSHVYFVAQGVLEGEGATNATGAIPAEHGENLYVFERDAQYPHGRLSFIATLAPKSSFPEPGETLVPENPTVTPDGQFFVFTTIAKLTPGDTSTGEQVFEYNAQTEELVRVSIGQDGFNDNGNTDIFNAQIPPQVTNYPVAVSDNGAYVAFESPDGLTPGALNGDLQEFEYEKEGRRKLVKYYAENVYEYHDGNVYLISDGQDISAAPRNQPRSGNHPGSTVILRGMSPSGEDIFFETADQLVPQALSSKIAVYDARIDGGFPAPASLVPCSGDACQGSLSATPTLLSPGSEFQAGVNPPPVVSAPASTVKPKALTTAQKLANALKACKKDRSKKKRVSCEKQARKKYATSKKAKKAGENRKAKS